MRAMFLGIAVWLSLAAQASAAQFVFAFSGIVTSVTAHAEVDGRSVDVGAPIAGGYSYDINAGNPEQTINNRFWFEAGTLERDIDNLLLLPGDKIASQIIFSPDNRPDLSYVEFMSLDASGIFDFRYTGRFGFLEFAALVDVRDVSPVPAPGGAALLACAGVGLMAMRRRVARAGQAAAPRA
jgi:hypothetical protein